MKKGEKLTKVTVEDMANTREKRVQKQKELLEKYNLPLISFTLNIPGPIKTNLLIKKGFELGSNTIKNYLTGNKVKIEYYEETHSITGDEAFFVVDEKALFIKEKMLNIEENHPFGVLFDIDVIDTSGKKIERSLFNSKERKCLICSKNAKQCARNRTHTASELYKKANNILRFKMSEMVKDRVASNAIKSLIYELLATPKPGLVDRNNNGSHNDMDIFTFVNSSTSLYTYFCDCFNIGQKTKSKGAGYTLLLLRDRGKEAELTMYDATSGVNTHKGAIFSLGVVSGAIGRLYYNGYITGDIYKEVQRMCKGLQKSDYSVSNKNSPTNGEKLYKNYKITGVRGEAESGFATVKDIALPMFKNCLTQGYDVNTSLSITLLYIIKSIDDTVLISRSSLERSNRVKSEIANLLSKKPYPSLTEIKKIDDEFIYDNLSSGGAADLLSVCYFIYLMENDLKLRNVN